MTTTTNTATLPCFHVTTAAGQVYGVAATCKRDAFTLTAERIGRDGSNDAPATAERVGRWTATYGTVIAY